MRHMIEKLKGKHGKESRTQGAQSDNETEHPPSTDPRTFHQVAQLAGAEQSTSVHTAHIGRLTPEDSYEAESQDKRGLWEQAQDDLSTEDRKAVLSLVFQGEQSDVEGNATDKMSTTIQDVIDSMKKRQKKHEGREDIRDLTTKIVEHLTQAGDFAMNFTPSVAQQIWPIAKWLLQIPVAAGAQMTELLKIADNITNALALGCVYETYYDRTNTPGRGLHPLHQALIKVYKCALQLLAIAARLLSKGSLNRTFKSLWDPGAVESKAGEFAELLNELRSAVDAARTAKTARSNALLNSYMQKWNLSMADTDKNQRRELLDWVSQVRVGDHLKVLVDDRVPETCEWLLAHETFRDWEMCSQSSLIWLRGAVGTGKSFLISKAIQHRQQVLEGPADRTLKQDGLAFFFFNREDQERNTALSCLKSLIRQLSTPGNAAPHILPSLKGLRERCDEPKRSLFPEDCMEQIKISAGAYATITIIIDAVDECNTGDKTTGRDALFSILTELADTSDETPFKIFISGRPDKDLRAFQDHTIIDVTDNDGDIQRFLEHKVEYDSEWEDEELKALVVDTVLKKCKSVFLLANLQIAYLTNYDVGEDVKDHLETLPQTLRDIYDEIYAKQIARKGKAAARISKRAILWVLAHQEPLTSDQLRFAIRVNPVTSILGSASPIDTDDINEDLEEDVTPEMIIKLCANFLILREYMSPMDEEHPEYANSRYGDSRRWQFCHASVPEYFTENHFSVLEACSHVGASGVIACIRIYGQGNHSGRGRAWKTFPVTGLRHNPIEDCFSSWMKQIRRVDQSVNLETDRIQGAKEIEQHSDVLVSVPHLRGLLQRFLGHPNRLSEEFCSWAQKHKDWDEDSCASAYFPMVEYGFTNLLTAWWDMLRLNAAGVQAHDTGTGLASDTNFRISVWYEPNEWNLLQWACLRGNTEVVRKLIGDAGMTANDRIEGTQCPLSIACEGGHLEICKTILQSPGCDVNFPQNLGNPLYCAAKRNKAEIVQFLLLRGASPDSSGWTVDAKDLKEPGSPLAVAIERIGFGKVVQYLMDQDNGDPNTAFQNAHQGSAAITAAVNMDFEVLKYMVQHRRRPIDPNANITTGRYGSILSGVIASIEASERYPSDVIEQLAALDVDLTAPLRYPPSPPDNHCYGSAVEYFAGVGDFQRVQDLIERGVKVNAPSEYGV